MSSEKKEKRILLISFTAGLLFAIAEFIFAVFTHSQSVLMDAVYDAVELVFIALVLFLTPLFYKPVSEKHPYGYYQIESIFLIVKSFMMLSVTLGVAVDIIQTAMTGGNQVDEPLISLFQLILGIACLAVFLILKKMNHSVSSPTVKTELLEWKIDIAYSAGLSVAFYLSSFLKNTPLAVLSPYFDSLVAVLVMALMLPQTLRILIRSIKDVFLFPPDGETVENIRKISAPVLEAHEFEPVFYDITRTGRHIWVAIYFTVNDRMLEVKELKRVTAILEGRIQQVYPSSSCDLILDT